MNDNIKEKVNVSKPKSTELPSSNTGENKEDILREAVPREGIIPREVPPREESDAIGSAREEELLESPDSVSSDGEPQGSSADAAAWRVDRRAKRAEKKKRQRQRRREREREATAAGGRSAGTRFKRLWVLGRRPPLLRKPARPLRPDTPLPHPYVREIRVGLAGRSGGAMPLWLPQEDHEGGMHEGKPNGGPLCFPPHLRPARRVNQRRVLRDLLPLARHRRQKGRGLTRVHFQSGGIRSPEGTTVGRPRRRALTCLQC